MSYRPTRGVPPRLSLATFSKAFSVYHWRTSWLPTHLRDTHQDYLAWKKSKRSLSRILGVATAVSLDAMIGHALFIFGIHLPPGRASGAVLLLPSFGGYFIPSALIAQSGILKFRREWMERGGLPAASGFASSLDVQLFSSLK